MRRALALCCLSLILAGTLWGCAVPSDPTPLPPTSSPPTATVKPSPSPTPQFRARVLDAAVLPGAFPGEARVVGLIEAQGDIGVRGVQLRVTLLSATGTEMGQVIVPLSLDHLAPGESAPFVALVPSAFEGAVAEVEVVGFTPAAFERAQVLVEPPEVTTLEDGSLALTGQVTNPGATPLVLNRLVFAALDSEARPLSLTTQTDTLALLEPGVSVPYQARTSDAPEAARWIEFADAVVAPMGAAGAPTVSEGPALRITAQGMPFVIGSLRNEGEQPLAAALLLVLRYEGKILSVSRLRSELPLNPGESLPFGTSDFPGLELRMQELGIGAEALEAEVLIDGGVALPPRQQSANLELEVESFDFGGSSFFMRGLARNPRNATLNSPSLYIAVRALDGELRGAKWVHLAPQIEAGESLTFVLDVPLPARSEPAQLEFDLRGLALLP